MSKFFKIAGVAFAVICVALSVVVFIHGQGKGAESVYTIHGITLALLGVGCGLVLFAFGEIKKK